MKRKKLSGRIMACALSAIMAFGSVSTAFASETANPDIPIVTEEVPNAEETAEPVAEALVEEPADETPAEEPAAEPAAETPTEEPAAEPAAETTTEEPAAEAQKVVEWSQQVGDSVVTVTANEGTLPQNAVLSASEITKQNEIKEIEKAVEEKAIEEQFAIEKMVAYDIKFLVDGTEVQPTANVNVSVSTPEIENGKAAAVLHVDENNVAENMDGSIDGEGNVVFDTPHFSTYVIIQQGGSEIKVTVEHYNSATNSKIYSDDVLTLPVGGKVNDYAKAENWTVNKVVVNDEEFSDEADYDEIALASDANIKVYYIPKEKTISGATTFYDYTVKAGYATNDKWANKSGSGRTAYSINMPGNYDNEDTRDKLSAGTGSQNYSEYNRYCNVGGANANAYVAGEKGIVKGIVKGLDEQGEVLFNYADPGFFRNSDVKITRKNSNNEDETRYLRQVYKDYTLSFQQSGDNYTLQGVKHGETQVAGAGADFFPLDKETKAYETAKTGHNFFFGMRYDVTFKIGDYVGALDYSFTGDDDLWVILDGEQVVIDLGGIHDALSAEVDLWQYIEGGKGAENLTPEEKEKEHTLTILYMERGAGKSNCQMNFTLPSARISEVDSVPMTDLVLHKVNSKDEALQGAQFKLVNETTGEIQTATSTSDGTVNFTKLREGTYTLTETIAPSEYIPSLETWIVKVELNSEGGVTATMYLSDGETPYTRITGDIYEVLNVTQQELIDSVMEYNKTAQVKNWDERTYDINITASSKLTSTTTEEKGGVADIMFVLDNSGSMLYQNQNSENNDEKGFVSVGRFNSAALDTTKLYYYGNDTIDVPYSSGNNTWYYTNAKCPMIYQNERWIYFDGSSWKNVPESSTKEIYTINSNLTGLKEAATTFVNSTTAASATSRIGIATFNSNSELIQELTTVDSTGQETLVKDINEIRASAGTSPQLGLQKALEQLEKNPREEVPQYVILFTDGKPSTGADKTATELAAEKLREKGIIVYTIGLGLDTDTTDWLSVKIASKDCAFEAGDILELKEIFKKIQNTITQNLDIANAQIKDVIDPRFVILDDSGNPITAEYSGIENGIRLNNGGTVYYDKATGYQYIEWTTQTIPNQSKSSWNKTITVVAKEEYIGGNNVPTNISPDSKISTGYGDAVLPQPTVNVKSDLLVNNNEVTIFYGDKVPTGEELTILFNSSSPQGIIDPLGTETLKKVTYTIGSDGKSISADHFTLEWYTDSACTQKVESFDDVVPEPDKQVYYLKVTYSKLGTTTTQSSANTNNLVAGTKGTLTAHNSQVDTSRLYGVYTVNVISGKIQITKTLDAAADKEQSFEFVVKKGQNVFKTVTVTIPEGETTATYTGTDLDKLSRGEYEVTESETTGYSIKEVAIGETTNCKNLLDSEVVKFTMGTNKKGNDIIPIGDYSNGKLGVITFTNEKTIADWNILKVSSSSNELHLEGAEFKLTLKSDNTKMYYGKSDETGKVVWYTDDNSVLTTSNIPAGSYTFKETKAPAGYVVSDEEWTVSIAKGGKLKSIVSGETTLEGTMVGTTCYFYFENTALYALPSAGGRGIFWYLISGTLLMMAGALILYKNKRGEVLES